MNAPDEVLPYNAELSCRRSAVQPSSELPLEFTRQALNRNAFCAGQLQRWVMRATYAASSKEPGDGPRWAADARAYGPAHRRARYAITQSGSGSAGARARGERGSPSRARAGGARHLHGRRAESWRWDGYATTKLIGLPSPA